MWVAVALLVVLALVLLGAWLIDRSAAKRGLKIHVRHVGLRREVSFTGLKDGEPRTWRHDQPGDDQNLGGSR